MGWWHISRFDSSAVVGGGGVGVGVGVGTCAAGAAGVAAMAVEPAVAGNLQTNASMSTSATTAAPSSSLPASSVMLRQPDSSDMHQGETLMASRGTGIDSGGSRCANHSGTVGAGSGSCSGRGGDSEEQDEMQDEYGSWDHFLEDVDLEALLAGGGQNTIATAPCDTIQTQLDKRRAEEREQQQMKERNEKLAAEAVAAAEKAANQQKEEELWQSLAASARTHVLPHLPEIVKRAWTIARYAQGESSSSSVTLQGSSPLVYSSSASPCPTSNSFSARGGGGVGVGGRVGFATGPRHTHQPLAAMTAPYSASGTDAAAPLAVFEVDAGVVLQVHAAAALLALRGSISGVSSSSNNYDNTLRKMDYASVREKYLELHRATPNPLLPQQRLLAPAFFCFVLENVCEGGGGGSDCSSDGGGDGDFVGGGGSTSERGRQNPGRGSSRRGGEEGNDRATHGSPPAVTYLGPRRQMILRETLRGREWEIMHLWMQTALDPIVFPVPLRRGESRRDYNPGGRHFSAQRGWNMTSGGSDADDPSDVVRDRFDAFTDGLAKAFRSGGAEARSDDRVRGGGSGRARLTHQDADDLVGVFDKRLTCFEPEQRASLSKDENKAS